MRRLLAAIVGAVALIGALLLPMGETAYGQNLILLVRTYSQIGRDGCLSYVAQWSDGSYSVVPWSCPPGLLPYRDNGVPAVRSYTERTRSGGIQYVALWADGVYTAVPAWYPIGLVPVKAQTAPFDAVAYGGYGYGPYYYPPVPTAPAAYAPYGGYGYPYWR